MSEGFRRCRTSLVLEVLQEMVDHPHRVSITGSEGIAVAEAGCWSVTYYRQPYQLLIVNGDDGHGPVLWTRGCTRDWEGDGSMIDPLQDVDWQSLEDFTGILPGHEEPIMVLQERIQEKAPPKRGRSVRRNL